ncbi:SDR family oxidoreductase [Stenotrophomonas sp. GD03701]|uniref:SDR family oxidoreductase n=1 Tax=Stenotrophomonas maltophilia TaxID=40324 RepID=A0A2J0T0P6_STEMA|nr:MULTISPECIES: SDR family oxidoreductase [Stenotrophomonas]MBA0312218.1 SDR family oxidoreductase [Stenotrophomonas maltophilia]MDH1387281.1 SDR family oxidoreductase [Stenotrophomonas sp. GD03701]MDH1391373.1 SDR family oxidoreductase [Stenotrophomonas sp. GD03702]MDQ7301843.1 SDR family oxidoreductase [Stenotrophomonas sp. Sm0581]PJL03957.1 dehydrogenase [Stenotrophomonas maltophilia]
MKLMVIGASRGLGRAFVEGLCQPGDTVVGVSRSRPREIQCPAGVTLQWIEADLAQPTLAADHIATQAPADIDVLIHNLGIWEANAFSDDYAFLDESDSALAQLIDVNVTATLMLLRRLLPRVLQASRPQLVLTGSTSALPRSGRPEVAFGASKFALNGIADALREGFRDRRLAVTSLQLGYLNTDDALSVPVAAAAARGDGELVPVHDVVTMVRALLQLSPSGFVRELVLPAIADPRY